MRVTIKHIYLTLILIFLLAPALGLLAAKSGHESCEKRSIHEFPSAYNDTTFFSEVEDYVTDRLLFRGFVNHWGSLFKYKVFNTPIKTDKVIPGKDGWLFYISKGDNIYDSYRHTNLLTKEGLVNWQNHWGSVKQKLKEKEIPFFMSVWPNKSTIYSNKVQSSLSAQQLDTLSKIDQITQYLKRNNSPLKILDIREELMLNKDVQLYKKHDTHWNAYGAFIGYQELVKHMGFRPLELSDYSIKWDITYKGDLIYLMGVCNEQEVISELTPTFQLKKDTKVKQIIYADRADLYINLEPFIDKKVIFFRDSYTSVLIPFLTHQFSECLFVWSAYDEGLIDKYKPDVVVVCPVERYF